MFSHYAVDLNYIKITALHDNALNTGRPFMPIQKVWRKMLNKQDVL
jgi:hypothetical protein